MPPKPKKNEPSKKTDQKKKEKVIEVRVISSVTYAELIAVVVYLIYLVTWQTSTVHFQAAVLTLYTIASAAWNSLVPGNSSQYTYTNDVDGASIETLVFAPAAAPPIHKGQSAASIANCAIAWYGTPFVGRQGMSHNYKLNIMIIMYPKYPRASPQAQSRIQSQTMLMMTITMTMSMTMLFFIDSAR